jgi:DNA-binding SARP family transcriptional activator
MSTIQFRTLGTLDLRAADGRELHSLLAQPKRIALLAYLCIAQPRGYHRRDTLLGLFWPDADQEHARTSLRKSVHVLRRALGEDSVVSRGDEEIEVDRSRVSCDVESFEELIRANRFQEALEVYRGDLLTGFFVEDAPEFERWLHSQRARLKSAAARAAYEAAEQLEKKGEYAGALRFAERSLDLSDTDERTLRKVIELHVHAGDRAAALESYNAFARNLAAEYQTEPSVETRLLVERVRSGAAETARVVSQPNADGDRQTVTPASSPTSTDSKPSERSRPRSAKRVLPAAVLTILIMSAFVWELGRSSNSGQVVRYTLAVDSGEAMAPGASYWSRLAISPNGKRLAYIGGPNWELLIRPRDSLHATTIPNTKNAMSPFFSPDGQRVGFLGEQRVYIVDNNGELITVCDTLSGIAGASWGNDGFIYVDGQFYERLLRVPAKRGGRPEWFTTMDSTGHVGKDGAYKQDSHEIDHTWPDVLPNGKGVLFAIVSAVNESSDTLSYSIGVAEIPSGKHRVLINDAKYARYAASGHLLYVTTRKTLMVVPFDQNSMTVTGEPRTLVEGMRLGRFGSADVAVSQTGTLVYATGGGAGRQELVWMTRDGKLERIDPDWIGDFWNPVLSPDGKRVAIARRLDGARMDIWVKQLDRGPSIRLTREQVYSDLPAWTPDGKSVTFLSEKDSRFGHWTGRADGSTPPYLQVPKTLTRSFLGHPYMPVWSPDGKWLIYSTDPAAADSGNIVGFRPGLDSAPIGIVATNNREVAPAVSPDGRWLAYVSNETGQYEVYVTPFPNTRAARWAISGHGGSDPQWSPRGNELFYRDDAGNFVAVEVKTRPTFSVGHTTVLFSTSRLSMFRAKRYAVAPDASRFLMIQSAEGGPEKLIVVDNWFEELKAKAN